MNGESLDTASEFFQPFPQIQDVFTRNFNGHAKYLLPVATLSLSHISTELSGKIHFIMPIEPVGGYGVPGENSGYYHNYLCRPNWIGYTYCGDRCELACDFRSFHKAFYADQPPKSKLQEHEAHELIAHYAETRCNFEARKTHFHRYGWFCADPVKWNELQDPSEDWSTSIVRNIGGVSFVGNWSCADDFPISVYPDKCNDDGDIYDCDRVLPQTEDGRDFIFIGGIELWNFVV